MKDDFSQSEQKTREMFALVETYMNSPLSREAFCKAQGIKLSRLSYWVTKYRRRDQPKAESGGGFIPLKVEGKKGMTEILHPCGVRISLSVGVSANYLAELLKGLSD